MLWEGIAEEALVSTGCDDPPVDAHELADMLEVTVRWTTSKVPRRSGDEVFVSPDTRISRIHGEICHELGHWLLDKHKQPQSERGASFIGAAMLVPRRSLNRQLRRGWDLHALMAVHVNASAELLARRIIDVREHARFALWDAGKLRYRIGRAHDRERDLVNAVLETGEPQREDDLCGAWPIFDGPWRRVIVLAA